MCILNVVKIAPIGAGRGLKAVLDYIRADDCLVVWKLDRPDRSLPHLIQVVTTLREKEVAFRSLTKQMDTTTAHGELLLGLFGALDHCWSPLVRGGRPQGLAWSATGNAYDQSWAPVLLTMGPHLASSAWT
jgi:hypothetical protein